MTWVKEQVHKMAERVKSDHEAGHGVSASRLEWAERVLSEPGSAPSMRPTMALRYLGDTLQQAWIGSDGVVQWQDVPRHAEPQQ